MLPLGVTEAEIGVAGIVATAGVGISAAVLGYRGQQASLKSDRRLRDLEDARATVDRIYAALYSLLLRLNEAAYVTRMLAAGEVTPGTVDTARKAFTSALLETVSPGSRLALRFGREHTIAQHFDAVVAVAMEVNRAIGEHEPASAEWRTLAESADGRYAAALAEFVDAAQADLGLELPSGR